MSNIVSENYRAGNEGWAKIMHHYFKDEIRIKSREIHVFNRRTGRWEKSNMAKLRVMFADKVEECMTGLNTAEDDVIKKRYQSAHGISELIRKSKRYFCERELCAYE
jgi:hypothetical protein